jgi:hypothetical protein
MRWGEMGGVKIRDILRLEFGIALQEEGGGLEDFQHRTM